MTRRIVTQALQSRADEPTDSYAARVVKYIPADVVAAWIAVSALLPGDDARTTVLLWGVFGVMLVVTPLWTLRVTRLPGRRPAVTQAAISTAAFAVWVFATGAPFAHYSFYDSALGGVVLILFTLVSGVVVPDTPESAGSG
jgi:hypothetical protein